MSIKLIVFLSVLVLAAAIAAPKCSPGSVAPQHAANQNICYIFVNQSKTFDDAESYCKQQNGHLVTVNDVFTDLTLASQSLDYFPTATNFWIGARVKSFSNVNQWVWTKCNGVLDYSNWKDPADSGTSPSVGSCAALTIDDITWASVTCNTSLPFVCQVPGIVNTCDDEYVYYPDTAMCYKQIYDPPIFRTFDQAEANCSADGGHLASIHNDDENTFVSSLAPGWAYNETFLLWIGAKSDAQAKYTWTDGTDFDYHNWYNGHGYASTCTALYSDGESDGSYRMMWYGGYGCSNNFGRFICKRPPSHVPFYSN